MRRGRDKFAWPDNDAIFRTWYGVKLRSDGARVRLGPYAFFKAWLVTFGVWCVVTSLSLLGPSDSFAFTLWVVVLIFSFFIAALFGIPVALLLDWMLRRVHQQWIHVLVFGIAFAFFTGSIASLLLNTSVWGLSSGLALIVGSAAAIGRVSVRHDVQLYTIPNPGSFPTHLQK